MKLNYLLGKFKSNKAFISSYVLVMIGIYLILAVSLWQVIYTGVADSKSIQDETQAEFLAETAVQEARYYSRNIDTNYTGTSSEMIMTIGSKTIGSYEYSVAKSGNLYTITGTGYLPSKSNAQISKTRTISFRNPSPYVVFSDDFETNDLSAWQGPLGTLSPLWSTSSNDPLNGTYHARASTTINDTTTTLYTPTYDLSTYDEVELRMSFYKTGNIDNLYIEHRTGVSTWGVLREITNAEINLNSWTKPAFRIKHSSPTATTQYRIRAVIDNNRDLYLDEVYIAVPYAPYLASVDSQ